jgi:hypothetical protein
MFKFALRMTSMSVAKALLFSILCASTKVFGAVDIVFLAQKGDADGILRQFADGAIADQPNPKGHLALVAAGAYAPILVYKNYNSILNIVFLNLSLACS